MTTTTTTTTTTTAREQLAEVIRSRGPIRGVRVSGAACARWRYWGAVRYEIRLAKDGTPCSYPLGRAGRDRRSERLAHDDAEEIVERQGLPLDADTTPPRGRLDERQAADVLHIIG